MNRDCRRNTNVLGVGNGTCDYGTICTVGVGNGQGNKSCYKPKEPVNIYHRDIKDKDIEPFIGINNIEGVNLTLWVNIVLIVLILIIIYKVYNPRI